MPTTHTCSFCGQTFIHGIGILLVRKSGQLNWFCSRRCLVYMVRQGKDSRKIRWTMYYGKERRG
jgi:large subunit ribosomal protein L24e